MARKKINHVLHIVLCIVTLGFWLLVYIPILIAESIRNSREYTEQLVAETMPKPRKRKPRPPAPPPPPPS